ncbi:2Fe-2S iron-sulfur cluster-binding protein [uncultured Novosphingobium sp.]|uniref:2Fe-2S iron-sulfur cluster-binding protein n=1 Tax=uncultured Novosphingobium sp. TaxID=292277 RepID=UPI00374A0F2C
MATIVFIEPGGERRMVEAREGESLMRSATQAGIEGIIAECGGAMTCLTCHCYIDPARYDSLPPPTEEERLLLDEVLESRPNSRLSCQVVVQGAMDGLEVTLPAWQG